MLIPVDEYLRTSYRPDCDYVDGEVLERNSGDRNYHACKGRPCFISMSTIANCSRVVH